MGNELRTVVMNSLVPLPDPIPTFDKNFSIEHKHVSWFYKDPVSSFCEDHTQM